MKSTLIALALAASLLPLPALSQQAGMGMDHPGVTTEGPAAAAGGGLPMMQGMKGMGRGMLMNCPMMGRMGSMGGMAMGTGPAGDQGVTSLALSAVNDKMHRDMAITYTGNVDVDFVGGMIAHHQGAIDMAKVVRAFGSDAQIRELAETIIEAQEAEIVMMREWLAENVPQ